MPEYTSSMKEAKTATANLLNVDASDLSDDFIEAAIASGDLEAAMNGSDEAMIRLRQNLLESTIGKLNIDTTDVDNGLASVGTSLSELTAESYQVAVGTSLDDSGMYEDLQGLVFLTSETAEQANDILSSIGYDPHVTMETVTVTGTTGSSGDGTIEYSYPDPDDPENTLTGTLPWKADTDISSGQQIQVPIINGKETKKVAPNISSMGGGKSGGGGGGGGGGSKKAAKPKKAEKGK